MFEFVKRININLGKGICFALIVALIISVVPFSSDSVYADSQTNTQSAGIQNIDDEYIDDDVVDEQEYTIALNGMGVSVSPNTITVTSGGAYGDLPKLTKKNYNFTGWYTDPTEGELIENGDPVTDPVPETLYARWEGYEYTVTLDPARAKLDVTKYTVNYGGDYRFLPKLKRTGLVFMGWYTKKSGGKKVSSLDKVKLTGNIKLYAKWAPTWYLQTNKKWNKKWYRVRRENSTIGNAGCGPTTMAMVVASLKKTSVTPVTACSWSKKKGYKAYKSGTKDGFFKAYGKKYGIKVKKTYYGDLRYTKKKRAKKYHTQAKNAVKKGNWVIVLAGNGKWTKGSGHFILWYKTEGDYAMIRDSNSKSSGRAKAKVSTLMKQAKRYWVISVPKSKRVN